MPGQQESKCCRPEGSPRKGEVWFSFRKKEIVAFGEIIGDITSPSAVKGSCVSSTLVVLRVTWRTLMLLEGSENERVAITSLSHSLIELEINDSGPIFKIIFCVPERYQ